VKVRVLAAVLLCAAIFMPSSVQADYYGDVDALPARERNHWSYGPDYERGTYLTFESERDHATDYELRSFEVISGPGGTPSAQSNPATLHVFAAGAHTRGVSGVHKVTLEAEFAEPGLIPWQEETFVEEYEFGPYLLDYGRPDGSAALSDTRVKVGESVEAEVHMENEHSGIGRWRYTWVRFDRGDRVGHEITPFDLCPSRFDMGTWRDATGRWEAEGPANYTGIARKTFNSPGNWYLVYQAESFAEGSPVGPYSNGTENRGFAGPVVVDPDYRGYQEEGESQLRINIVGNGTTNPTPGTHVVDDGDTVSVEAVEKNPAYEFKEWRGDAAGSSEEINVNMSTDRTVTAVFENGGNNDSSEIPMPTPDPETHLTPFN